MEKNVRFVENEKTILVMILFFGTESKNIDKRNKKTDLKKIILS